MAAAGWAAHGALGREWGRGRGVREGRMGEGKAEGWGGGMRLGCGSVKGVKMRI